MKRSTPLVFFLHFPSAAYRVGEDVNSIASKGACQVTVGEEYGQVALSVGGGGLRIGGWGVDRTMQKCRGFGSGNWQVRAIPGGLAAHSSRTPAVMATWILTEWGFPTVSM